MFLHKCKSPSCTLPQNYDLFTLEYVIGHIMKPVLAVTIVGRPPLKLQL